MYWPTGAGPNDRGPVPQAHHRVDGRLGCAVSAPTTLTSTRRTGMTTRRARRRCVPSRTGPAGQGAVHRGVRVAGRGDRGGPAGRRADGLRPDRVEQPQYNMLWRVTSRGHPAVREGRHRADRLLPIAQECLPAITGRVSSRRPIPAPPTRRRANFISRWMRDSLLAKVQQLKPIADEAGLSLPSSRGLDAAEPRTCRRDHRGHPPRRRCGRT